jgi:hypothetical protein
MSTVNVYHTHGTRNEQALVEDLIVESLRIYSNEMFYIPRTIVSRDDILGEDRLSKFTNLFPIEAYFENVDSFDGQGAFIQKFGLMMEQSATLVVARRRWEQLVGKYNTTQLPNRPCEGDLIYFPLTRGLFEIKFVKHQDPFYQLGRLYVYKLQVELFQYSSEHIDTGVPEVDVFEYRKTHETNVSRSGAGQIVGVRITNGGNNYTTATVVFESAKGEGAEADAIVEDGAVVAINVTNQGIGYPEATYVRIYGDGFGAVAKALVRMNIDKPDSYGDNNTFRAQSLDAVFNEANPFGDA